MTTSEFDKWHELNDKLIHDATEILLRSIRLKRKYNMPLCGLDNYYFNRFQGKELIYSGGDDYIEHSVPISALLSPDQYFQKMEMEIASKLAEKLENEVIKQTVKEQALAKLTTEEKLALGL